MKQVWKCDHCTQTEVFCEAMIKHEEACSFNPENKTCWSCVHRKEEGIFYDSWNTCEAGVTGEAREDAEDGVLCGKYANGEHIDSIEFALEPNGECKR